MSRNLLPVAEVALDECYKLAQSRNQTIEQLSVKLVEAMDRVRTAESMLLRYGAHDPFCPALWHDKPCTCGFVYALDSCVTLDASKPDAAPTVAYWQERFAECYGTLPPELYVPGPDGTSVESTCRRCHAFLSTGHLCADLRGTDAPKDA
jgi:hypothetical protein